MSRPEIDIDIEAGLAGWDADIESAFAVLKDGPLPLFRHTGSPGSESDLESAWPAAENDQCAIMVEHSMLGWCIAFSDGVEWHFVPKRAAAVSKLDPGSPAPSNDELRDKINELLDAMRASGVVATGSP